MKKRCPNPVTSGSKLNVDADSLLYFDIFTSTYKVAYCHAYQLISKLLYRIEKLGQLPLLAFLRLAYLFSLIK